MGNGKPLHALGTDSTVEFVEIAFGVERKDLCISPPIRTGCIDHRTRQLYGDKNNTLQPGHSSPESIAPHQPGSLKLLVQARHVGLDHV